MAYWNLSGPPLDPPWNPLDPLNNPLPLPKLALKFGLRFMRQEGQRLLLVLLTVLDLCLCLGLKKKIYMLSDHNP